MPGPPSERDRQTLRVLQLFQPADGGVPEHVRQLGEGLARRGHQVTAAGPAHAAPRARLQAAGVHFAALPLVGDMLAPRDDLASAARLAKLLHVGGFDLLHAHGQKAGLLGRPVARALGVPVIYTPHSFVYRTQLLRPRRHARTRFLVNRTVEQALGRMTDELIGCARDERLAAMKDHIVPAGRSRVIENAVDLDLGHPPDPRLREFAGGEPLLGFVSSLRDQKGLPTLLDALDLLAAARTPVRMAIVGDGPLRSQVEERVRASAWRDRVLVTGFGGRVEPYLAALDAFVLPSYWEGMPISVLEAMAFGLPVVATAVNGTPEAVADGETGLLVPPHDSRALAEGMARLAGDGALRARLGARGREIATPRFAVERLVDETLAAYREVLSR